jgi:hypothetical protein
MIILPKPARCVLCRLNYFTPTPESCCPHCGFSGYPMDPAQDIKAAINWHELRVLTIWAEMYVMEQEELFPGFKNILAAIVKPLQEQFPTFRPLLNHIDPVPPIN